MCHARFQDQARGRQGVSEEVGRSEDPRGPPSRIRETRQGNGREAEEEEEFNQRGPSCGAHPEAPPASAGASPQARRRLSCGACWSARSSRWTAKSSFRRQGERERWDEIPHRQKDIYPRFVFESPAVYVRGRAGSPGCARCRKGFGVMCRGRDCSSKIALFPFPSGACSCVPVKAQCYFLEYIIRCPLLAITRQHELVP